MACCYIAASLIALIIQTAEGLDLNLHIQYNDASEGRHYEESESSEKSSNQNQQATEEGVSIVSISGMTCAACTATVEKALLSIGGVDQALISLPFHEARIFHRPGISRLDLVDAIENAGYDAKLGQRETSQKIETLKQTKELATLKYSLTGLIRSSTLIFVLGKGYDWLGVWLGFNTDFDLPLLSLARNLGLLFLTALASQKYGHWIFENSIKAARKCRVNMHTLISVSTLLGLFLTFIKITQLEAPSDALYFDSVLGILLIITVGRYMDLLSRRRATDTFTGLYSLLSQTSSVKLAKLDGKRTPRSVVRPGDELVIEPFSIIACDSYVLSGSSHVNEALITGEPRPKTKRQGDLLLAGSRNGPNEMRAMVNQNYEDSFLSEVVRSVEKSLTAKVSVQQRVDTITQYFVSGIFAIAAGMGAYTFSSTPGDFSNAIDAAGRNVMTILASACPCALGLATPCAVMAGIDISWRKGILLLEGGETMERLQNITHVVMDKTGTLTQGTLAVNDIAFHPNWKRHSKELAVLICAVEEQSLSSHPLALAIFRKFLPMAEGLWHVYQRNGGVRGFAETGGRGVACDTDLGDGQWRHICVGNLTFMHANRVEGLESLSEGLATSGGSSVYVGVDGVVAASFFLQDVVRPDAKFTIEALKARGLEISMAGTLTGDNEVEASRISKELDIPVKGAHADPNAKFEHVKEMQRSGKKVVMIGDGMNDGPALAASDVGIMIAHGRKCLSSGGSVLLLQSQLESLLTLLDIAEATMRQISVNIVWALAYNVVAVSLAMGLGSPLGLLITPTTAAAMMSVSSVTITLRGLMLRARLSKKYEADAN